MASNYDDGLIIFPIILLILSIFIFYQMGTQPENNRQHVKENQQKEEKKNEEIANVKEGIIKLRIGQNKSIIMLNEYGNIKERVRIIFNGKRNNEYVFTNYWRSNFDDNSRSIKFYIKDYIYLNYLYRGGTNEEKIIKLEVINFNKSQSIITLKYEFLNH
jgi:preprotein translocase subunit YajC